MRHFDVEHLNKILTMKAVAFVATVLLIAIFGLYQKRSIIHGMAYSEKNVAPYSTSIEVDSVCFEQSGYDFCYKIFDRKYYYLVISKQDQIVDSIKLDPFVWNNIGEIYVFPANSSQKKYVLEINQQFILVLAPLNLASSVLIPVKLANTPKIEKSKVHWLVSESGFFIYDEKDKIIIDRIERGEEFGKAVLWRYDNGKLIRLKKADVQSPYEYPPTEAYMREVINIIND